MQGQQQRKRSPLPDEVKERTLVIESSVSEETIRHLNSHKLTIKTPPLSKKGYITTSTKEIALSILNYLHSVNVVAHLLTDRRSFSLLYKFHREDKPEPNNLSELAKEVSLYEPENENHSLFFAHFESLSLLISAWNSYPANAISVRIQKDTEKMVQHCSLVALHRSKHWNQEISASIIRGVHQVLQQQLTQGNYHLEAIPDKGCTIIYFEHASDRNYILNLKNASDNTGLALTFVEKATKQRQPPPEDNQHPDVNNTHTFPPMNSTPQNAQGFSQNIPYGARSLGIPQGAWSSGAPDFHSAGDLLRSNQQGPTPIPQQPSGNHINTPHPNQSLPQIINTQHPHNIPNSYPPPQYQPQTLQIQQQSQQQQTNLRTQQNLPQTQQIPINNQSAQSSPITPTQRVQHTPPSGISAQEITQIIQSSIAPIIAQYERLHSEVSHLRTAYETLNNSMSTASNIQANQTIIQNRTAAEVQIIHSSLIPSLNNDLKSSISHLEDQIKLSFEVVGQLVSNEITMAKADILNLQEFSVNETIATPPPAKLESFFANLNSRILETVSIGLANHSFRPSTPSHDKENGSTIQKIQSTSSAQKNKDSSNQSEDENEEEDQQTLQNTSLQIHQPTGNSKDDEQEIDLQQLLDSPANTQQRKSNKTTNQNNEIIVQDSQSNDFQTPSISTRRKKPTPAKQPTPVTPRHPPPTRRRAASYSSPNSNREPADKSTPSKRSKSRLKSKSRSKSPATKSLTTPNASDLPDNHDTPLPKPRAQRRKFDES